ncbi:hypothetical protein J6590_077170 [Homalodisca vitripennis]|nr:hypothetical protein J6590_087224 [Homalodisca vitripennis]KAG8335093.1 hypothetical protein J6590_077170 [Homalodisca vitripennis]
MAGGELRRSYTQMDFSLNRVNIRPQLPHLFHQQPPLQVNIEAILDSVADNTAVILRIEMKKIFGDIFSFLSYFVG